MGGGAACEPFEIRILSGIWRAFETEEYSYNKSQRDALFSQIYFGKELCMFRTDLLSAIMSLNTVYTATGICHASYVDCLLAGSGY